MDFSFSPEQQALAELARAILNDHATPERLKRLETSGEWRDQEAWTKLAEASLLGVAIPEELGGSGLGLLELGLLLEEVGRAVAPVPVLAALVLGALPIAAFGSSEQKQRWLPGAARGELVLTAALVELGTRDPLAPATTAVRAGGGWRLDGVKACVPAGEGADAILVPACTGGGSVGVFIVDPHAPGVTRERQVLTNREPHARVSLDGVAVAERDRLGGAHDGAAVLRWLYDRAVAAYCAVQVGVCDRALRMTAEYTIERKQFDRAIASFQAVQQRAADAYIDLESMRLAAWEALFRLARGDATEEHVAIAKFWAAEGGQHVAVAAQHLHGGIGVDVDYPLHRYFLWSKHIEVMLGSATEQLARLGARMAQA
jgi:3-oxocholest-4-en-26-oyl-CoA dehydrogenase beta subunit